MDGLDDFLTDVDWKKGLNDDSREVDAEPRLGDVAWQVGSKDGKATIVQTVVSELYHDGTIRLMKQAYRQTGINASKVKDIFFTKKEAQMAFWNMIAELKEQARKKHKEHIVGLDAQRNADLDAWFDKTKADGLKSDSLYANFASDADDEYDPDMVLPKQEFEIGQTVYLVASDQTTTMMSGSKAIGWKVVKSVVEKIQLYTNLNDPRISYDLDTSYRFSNDAMFATEDEAKANITERVMAEIKRMEDVLTNLANEIETVQTSAEHSEEMADWGMKYLKSKRGKRI